MAKKAKAQRMKKCAFCPMKFRELPRLSKHMWGKHHAAMLAKTRATRAKKAGAEREPSARRSKSPRHSPEFDSPPPGAMGHPCPDPAVHHSANQGKWHPPGCMCPGCR